MVESRQTDRSPSLPVVSAMELDKNGEASTGLTTELPFKLVRECPCTEEGEKR